MKLNQTYVLLILITVLFGCNKNLEKQIINIEKGKIGMIGYGSLMSKKSMERTLKRTYQDSVYLVHLEGYQRSWNASRSVKNPEKDLFYARDKDTIQIHNIIALNIIESDNEKINCVLFFITPEELAQFDIREKGYNRIDVTDKINEYGFIGGEVYVYKADKEHTYSYNLKENTVLPKGYFELVTKACDSIGVKFRQEFESSTKHLDKVTVLPYSAVFWIEKEKTQANTVYN
jgi:hypothetical protein